MLPRLDYNVAEDDLELELDPVASIPQVLGLQAQVTIVPGFERPDVKNKSYNKNLSH